MIARLAFRNVARNPGRSAFLFAGYGIGVGVMIVLLSIGEALVTQARDERLVGGGDITVLPAGIDVEVMKTGGLGGLFFSIAQARFIYLQLLASPRLAGSVTAVAPQIEGKLLYLRANGREYAVRASGEIPSRTRLVGGMPVVVRGDWQDDSLDRRWIAPTPAELRADIDHFHVPPPDAANVESWAEWHYFNVLSDDARRWAFISFIVGGDVPDGRWGGRVLVTTHEQRGAQGETRTVRYTADAGSDAVRFSTSTPDLEMDASSVTLMPDGNYRVRAFAREEGKTASDARVISVDMVVTPAPRAYFPGASVGGDGSDFISGYTVPALRARASGQLCVARSSGGTSTGDCEVYEGAQAYHDHNWGVWRGVTWEWGETRAGEYTILYGQVQPPDSVAATAPLFVYIVDSLGFLAIFRPDVIRYTPGSVVDVDGRPVRVPASAVIADARGDDTLRLELTMEDASVTDMAQTIVARGDAGGSGSLPLLERRYFVQMKGRARLSGRIDGVPLTGEGPGFFETYVAGRE
ncbi:MAG: hypothetical protein ACRENI_13430 [Gemmatimonadaceae bacterium]